MTDDTREPLPNDHRATQGLDPSPVDTETPDVNQAAEGCQVVEATTRDGQPVTFAVHAVAPLTEPEQAMLGQVAQAAAERMRRDDPYGGVITELMQAGLRSQLALRSAAASQLADRLSAAVRAAADVIRAGRVERMSRFRWAEEAARLDAELVAEGLLHAGTQGERDAADDFAALVRGWLDVPDEPGWANAVHQRIADLRADAAASEATLDHVRTSLIEYLDVADELSLPDVLSAAWSVVDERDAARIELAELRKRAVTLPGDWHGRIRDCVNQQTANRLVTLIESWRSTPSGWSCKCGMDVTDMVHTAERCYSTTSPIVDGGRQ